jgi:hypothetical protein
MNLATFENRISSFLFATTAVVAACSFFATAQSASMRSADAQNETISKQVEVRLAEMAAEVPSVVVSAAADLRSTAGNMLGSAGARGRHILAE